MMTDLKTVPVKMHTYERWPYKRAFPERIWSCNDSKKVGEYFKHFENLGEEKFIKAIQPHFNDLPERYKNKRLYPDLTFEGFEITSSKDLEYIVIYAMLRKQR